jgi:hypothetical protein
MSISRRISRLVSLLDDEYGDAVQLNCCAARLSRHRPGIDPHRNRDVENRTASDFALHLDPPAHHLAQAPHDR